VIGLVDTDVLVDLALGRAPDANDAATLIDALERGAARGFVAWHKDFEDAMKVGAALACGAEVIANRNTRDFRKSPIPALAPAQLVARMT
jgi:hypothetical protein